MWILSQLKKKRTETRRWPDTAHESLWAIRSQTLSICLERWASPADLSGSVTWCFKKCRNFHNRKQHLALQVCLSLFSLNVVSLESSLPHPSPTSTLTAYPPQGLKGSSASSPLPEASTWLPPERDQKCLRNKISLVPFFMTKQPFFKASVMQLNNG